MLLTNDIILALKEIERVTGFDACQYRETTLMRRLSLRLSATKSKTYQDYLKVLKQNPSEIDLFIQTLTINVTDFFRDNDAYQILKKEILPELTQKAAATKRKRIVSWSIASSRGQEPYSLAMLFHSVLGDKIKDFDIRILATDLDDVALEKAKRGVYSASDVKNVPRAMLRQHFTRKMGEYEVKPSLKDLIRFRQIDVIKSTPAGKFDLVLCRNLFIFFKRELQIKVIEKIHSVIKRDGILVLGKAEALSDDDLFHTLFPRHRIYQKKN